MTNFIKTEDPQEADLIFANSLENFAKYENKQKFFKKLKLHQAKFLQKLKEISASEGLDVETSIQYMIKGELVNG